MTRFSTFRLDIVRFPLPKFGRPNFGRQTPPVNSTKVILCIFYKRQFSSVICPSFQIYLSFYCMTLVSTFKLDIVRFSLPKFGHNYPLDKAYTLYMTQIFQISGMFSNQEH